MVRIMLIVMNKIEDSITTTAISDSLCESSYYGSCLQSTMAFHAVFLHTKESLTDFCWFSVVMLV